MSHVVSAVLGGGQGTRLWPLTQYRAKPAVPVGGKFRLIDIPISNSLHADVDRIYVLTQFNSASLHRHIAQTYRFDVFSSGFVNILAAEQNIDNRDWYQGTADAVRQNLERLTEGKPSEVVILSGDQLYMMDLSAMLELHRRREADLTIAVKPVSRAEAPGLGILRIDTTGRLVEFVEKPTSDERLDSLTLDEETIRRLELDAEPGQLLASMGIYAFRGGVLRELLRDDAVDFGREVIPASIGKKRVFGYVHNGYWRDIGTIGSFHEANLELTRPLPALNLYSQDQPIYTHARFLPGSKIDRCSVTQSILADGSILSGSSLSSSIVGLRAVVRSGSRIERSVIMGATRYEIDAASTPPLGIGHDCEIVNAIVDINARLGDGCRLVNAEGVQEADGEGWCIRDGIVVIPRGAVLRPGTVI